MAAWLAQRGWRTTSEITYAYAFVDEARLLSTTVRRIWHTPLTAERTAPPTGIQTTLQIEGQTTFETRTATTFDMTGGMTLLSGADRFTAFRSTAPSGRIEIEFAAVPRELSSTPTLLARMDDAATWAALTAAANALLNAVPVSWHPGELHLQAGFVSLVSALAVDLADRSATPAREGNLFTRAVRIIEQDSGDPALTVGTLAQRLGVSPRHLARVFHERGESARDAIGARRLRAAQLLMRENPGLPLGQVAREAGFASTDALHRRLARHR